MKNRSEVISAVANAYKAAQNIAVVSVSDCRRKVIINDSLEYALKLLEKEKEEAEIPEESNDNDLCKSGQAQPE